MPVSRSGGGNILTKITGSVFDDKGEPALGTSIMVADSKIGIVANSGGQSTLSVPSDKKLVVCHIGMTSQTVTPRNGMTFVVLDNASVHNRCKLMNELRQLWERRDVCLFFLPPYSPHFYSSTGFLLYATNQTLAAIGAELNINFAHVA